MTFLLRSLQTMFLIKQKDIKRINVKLPQRDQEIFVGGGLAQFLIDRVSNKKYSKIVGFVDKNILEMYPDFFRTIQEKLKINKWILVDPSEKSKSLETLNNILNECLKFKPDRKSCFLAIGGGIVGDVAGFLASVYMRGIELVFVPTTLTAQADTIINKVGISYKLLKNIIGSFYSPVLTVCDVQFLKTLPKRELSLGFSEIIKHALIDSEEFVFYLEKIFEKHTESISEDRWKEIVYRSLRIKSKLVSHDPFDVKGYHKGLSYGHTFANVLEGILGFEFRHGEAIAVGMHLAGLISNKLHFLSDKDFATQKKLFLSAKLPIELTTQKKINKNLFIQMLKSDKISVDGEISLVLLEKIGKFGVHKISNEEVINWALDLTIHHQ